VPSAPCPALFFCQARAGTVTFMFATEKTRLSVIPNDEPYGAMFGGTSVGDQLVGDGRPATPIPNGRPAYPRVCVRGTFTSLAIVATSACRLHHGNYVRCTERRPSLIPAPHIFNIQASNRCPCLFCCKETAQFSAKAIGTPAAGLSCARMASLFQRLQYFRANHR